MDLDLSYISALVREGNQGFLYAKKEGVTSDYLKRLPKHVFAFIEKHVTEFGEFPSTEFLLIKTKIKLNEPKDSLEMLTKEVKKRHLWEHLTEAHDKMGVNLKVGKPYEALEEVQRSLRGIYQKNMGGGKVGSLLKVGSEVLDLYDRIKNGERGILTPWPTMNEMTLGFWPGDLVVFVGRLGTGKSFLMLLLAREAWMNGKKVLFVGTEMSRLKLATRFYSIHLKMPYKSLRKGQLGDFQEKVFKKRVREIENEEGFYIMGDEVKVDMAEIEATLDEVRPDILFVDGMYLVTNEGLSRYERVSNTADDLKKIAKQKNIPIVVSQQFNRLAGASRSALIAENVALSDTIGWNADLLIALYQQDDMRGDKTMGFKPMKIREGEPIDFFSNWDFDNMDFEEQTYGTGVSDDEEGDDDDDPSGRDGDDDNDLLL